MKESILNSLPLIGGIIVLVVIFFALIKFIANNYIKVGPDKAAVFFGRKYKDADGQPAKHKIVTNGAKLKIPILEEYAILNLNLFTVDISTKDAPNKDGVPVTLVGVANLKILSDDASLKLASERFLHKTLAEIKDIAFENLEGHLRSIVGRMTIEELIRDRTKLNQEILGDAAADLKKLGLGIELLTIKDVSDSSQYIDQLGRKRTAEVTRDAEIGEAEAKKESRIKTTDAEMAATKVANKNQEAIFESDRDRDVKKAEFRANVETQKAKADQAGPLAEAEARKQVVAAEQDVLVTEKQKKIEIAEEEVKRKEKELEADTIKPAEAEKEASVLKAQGQKEADILAADAEKAKLEKEGEGQAAANKAILIAEAEGNKAKGLAEAEVIREKLLAEAEGVLKKAEAYEKLDETGKLLLILETVERIAPAVVREFAGVMEAASKPFGEIDNINIIDFGGNGFGNGSALSKFGQVAPEMIFKFFAAAQAGGLDISGLLKKVGIDPGNFLELNKEEVKQIEKSPSLENSDKSGVEKKKETPSPDDQEVKDK